MIALSIKGNPPSKSNCYRVGKAGNRCIMYKGSALKAYESSFGLQVMPSQKQCLDGDLSVEIKCHFDSRRPDLDNAAKCILDSLQSNNVIKNDRCIIDLKMTKHLDKENPRAEIIIREV